MAWKHVANVYNGGTEELKTLRNALVRARYAQEKLPNHQGQGLNDGEPVSVSSGQFGRLGEPYKTSALIAVLRRPKEVPPPLEKLRYGDFDVIRVDWVMFREMFDIEMP